MELNTQEILNAQFYTLPLAVQDTINENEWKLLIKKLASDYRLHQDQVDIIESITLLTMLGFAETEAFSRNIVEEANIDPTIANEIGRRMDLEVFDVLEQIALLVAQEQEEELGDDSLYVLDKARTKELEDASKLDELDLSNASDRAAQKLLDEIENPENYIPTEAKDHAETKLQNNVDSIIDGEEVSEPSKANTKQPESVPTPTQTKPATHMRTLKSDIVKAKLQNPSWQPEITKKTDEDVASITQAALQQSQNTQQEPQSDQYREQI